jgi:uncharacterized SAM-binding protein YcdF (DUF218 family)
VKIVRVLLGLVGAVLALWLVSLGLVLLAGASPQLRKADAILVLGAAQYNGRPSPVLKARIDHALDLWNQGLAPRLIFTGGIGAGDTISEGEVGRRYAMKHGVPDSVIMVDRVGSTSRESMEAAATLMRGDGLHSALIVSDSYHMLRLMLLARQADIASQRAPTPDGPIDREPVTRRHYVLRESLLVPATLLLGIIS